MNRVVFNGQTGGLGRYLAEALKQKNISSAPLTSRLEDEPGSIQELNSISVDAHDVVTLIPLAGLIAVSDCEMQPERAFKINVTETLALVNRFLDWARRKNAKARVLYVSTGHIYAAKAAGERLKETDPASPRSVYARTKLQAEDALRALFQKNKNDLLIARVFGLLSPKQSIPYVLPAFIERVKKRDFSNMRGLDGVRDYIDARDACRVLAAVVERDWNLLSRPPNNVVNISSGEGVVIRDLFAQVVRTAGLSPAEVERSMTTAPPRPDDIASMVGDPSLIASQIKIPLRSIPLAQTVADAF